MKNKKLKELQKLLKEAQEAKLEAIKNQQYEKAAGFRDKELEILDQLENEKE